MSELILYSLIAGLFSLVGGVVLVINPLVTQKYLTPLLSFGAGAFLSAAFLHILPEAIEIYHEPHPILAAALAGFMIFFLIERLLMKYFRPRSHHEHSDHTESLAVLIILGDAFHNFLDGIVLGAAYLVNPLVGLPTALALAAHEIPQEIGDFAILLKLKWKKSHIIAINIAQSLLTIPGVLAGVYVGHAVIAYLPFLLAIAAGIFLYIAASDLIPEIHHRAGHTHFLQVIGPTLLAMGMVFYFSELAALH